MKNVYTRKFYRNDKKSPLFKESSASSIKEANNYKYNLHLPKPPEEENLSKNNNNYINTIENNDIKDNNKKLNNNKTNKNIFNASNTIITFHSLSKTDEKDKDKEKEGINQKLGQDNTSQIRRRINFRERLNNSRKKRAFFKNNNDNNNKTTVNKEKEKNEQNKDSKTPIIEKIENIERLKKDENKIDVRFSRERKKTFEIIKENIEKENIPNENEKDNSIIDKDIKEENFGNEIKDTVKCKICFQKMVHPKMCPKCQNISCEKCLYNWFLKDQNKECIFCKEPINFYEYISVPFMDTFVDFVEKVIYDRKQYSSSFQSKLDNNLKFFNNEDFLINDNSFFMNDNCEVHNREKIHYYCLNCNKGYCKTCFVFFGKEKDKHVNHKIIEYSNYKKLNLPLLKKKEEEIDCYIDNINNLFDHYNSYKQLYKFEQKAINDFISLIQKEYNKKIDETIQNIENKIIELEQSMDNYKKVKKEIEDFYKKLSVKSRFPLNSQQLIDKIEKMNDQKNMLNEAINEPETIKLKVYKSENEEISIDNKYSNEIIKLGDKLEMNIDYKIDNYININLKIPKDNKDIHFYKAIIYYKIKGTNKIYSDFLDRIKEGKNYYLMGKTIQIEEKDFSIFEIKCIFYDFYFE